MGLKKHFKCSVIALAVAGSLFLWGCDNYQPPAPNPKTEVIDAFSTQKFDEIQRNLSDKRLALALLTIYDGNQATGEMEEMFQNDFSDLPDYVLYTARTGNLDVFFNNLRDYSAIKPIDTLILVYHGNRNRMKINFRQSINTANAQRLFQDYSSVLADDAVVLLYSCSTGESDKNIATALANALNRDVVAPRQILIPETDLTPSQRLGEFGPDENGRASFDLDNFASYEKIVFRGRGYIHAMATYSYEIENGDVINGRTGADYFLTVDK